MGLIGITLWVVFVILTVPSLLRGMGTYLLAMNLREAAVQELPESSA